MALRRGGRRVRHRLGHGLLVILLKIAACVAASVGPARRRPLASITRYLHNSCTVRTPTISRFHVRHTLTLRLYRRQGLTIPYETELSQIAPTSPNCKPYGTSLYHSFSSFIPSSFLPSSERERPNSSKHYVMRTREILYSYTVGRYFRGDIYYFI